jgi:hypothetical protein
MEGLNSYNVIAHAYVDGVRTLFTPSVQPGKERGAVRGPSTYEDLAKKAEALSGVSDSLGKEIAAQLSASDPGVRMDGSTRMLAKALTDLEVGAQLLQAAEDEEEKWDFRKVRGAERGRGGLGASEEYLKILLGEDKEIRRSVERGGAPQNIVEARGMLSAGTEDVLTLISDRANKTAKSAMGGLLGLGAGELAKTAGALSMSVAELLGQAEKVSHLYDLFRTFVSKVYDALAALIGEPLLQAAGQKVVEWVNELREERYFPEILERLYQTKATQEELKKFVGGSHAALEKFTSTIQGLDGLKDGYGNQVKLAEKLLKGLKLIGGLSEAVLPQGKLVFAACYMALGGYVVLSGADYVDSPRMKWLDRAVGVRRLVEGNLKTA